MPLLRKYINMAEFINKFYFSVVQNIKSLIYFYSDQVFLSKIAFTSFLKSLDECGWVFCRSSD